jgi:hypothetical protein
MAHFLRPVLVTRFSHSFIAQSVLGPVRDIVSLSDIVCRPLVPTDNVFPFRPCPSNSVLVTLFTCFPFYSLTRLHRSLQISLCRPLWVTRIARPPGELLLVICLPLIRDLH